MKLRTKFICGLSAAALSAGLLTAFSTIKSSEVKADDPIVAQALFGSSYNNKSVSSYSDSWSCTVDGQTWNIVNFNNNKNGWNYVKTGSKNNPVVGTITSETSITGPVSYAVISISAITATAINSIVFSYGASSDCTGGSFTIDKSTGDKTVNFASSLENMYYKLTVDCAKASANGPFSLSSIKLFGESKTSVTSVHLNKNNLSLKGGESESLVATVLPDDATDKSVTWSSDDETVASVSAAGLVSAVGPGTANITVKTTDGNLTDSCVVTVSDFVTAILADAVVDTFEVGTTIYGSNFEVYYETYYGNDGIASDGITINNVDASIFSYTFVDADVDSKTFTVGYEGLTEEVTINVNESSATSYSVSVEAQGGSYVLSSDTIYEGNSVTISLTPAAGYKLPGVEGITVLGAEYSYENGVITIHDPSDEVSVTVIFAELDVYTISVSATHASFVGSTSVMEGNNATLTFTADEGYYLPTNISVSDSNVSVNYDKHTGIATFSNISASFSVSVVAEEIVFDHLLVEGAVNEFTLGDDFVFGGSVKAYYSDETYQVVTDECTFTGYDMYATGEQTVTVNWGSNTTQYTITVNAVTLSTYYEKVTSDASLSDGQYLIAYEGESVVLKTTNDIANNGSAVTINSGVIQYDESLSNYEFTLNSETGSLRFTDDYYIYHTGSSNTLNRSTDEQSNDITIDSDGFAHITSGDYILKFNTTAGQKRFRYYSSSSTQPLPALYKKVTQSASLIKLNISLKDKTKVFYDNDPITPEEFVVEALYNDGTKETITDFVIDTNKLVAGDNVITFSYGDFDEEFTIHAEERAAEVTSVTLVKGAGVKYEYVYYPGIQWDYSGLSVKVEWTDSSFDTEVSLASLIEDGKASVSPAVPSVGVTSFTVNYSVGELDIANNSVDVSVRNEQLISISASVSRTFYVGETLTKDDITLLGNYEISGEVEITDFDFDDYFIGYDEVNGGEDLTHKEFTIYYDELSTTLEVNFARKAFEYVSEDVSFNGTTLSSTGVSTSSSSRSTGEFTIAGLNLYLYETYAYNANVSFSSSKSSAPGYLYNVDPLKLPIAGITTTGTTPNIRVSVDGESWILIGDADLVNVDYYFFKLDMTGLEIKNYVNISNITIAYKNAVNANALANFVMFNDTVGQCKSKFDDAEGKFSVMSDSEKSTFMTSEDYVISTARTRFLAWAANQGKEVVSSGDSYVISEARLTSKITKTVTDNTIMIITICSATALLAISGYFFYRKRKLH